MSKFPDHTLETALRKRGINVQCMWQMKGPPNTEVAWMECLLVGKTLVIVQTYKEFGWEVFIASSTVDNDTTIERVVEASQTGDLT